jgi:NTP pyrophosphatase (non-canonical NTP hydrolase)
MSNDYGSQNYGLNSLRDAAHAAAREKGWYDKGNRNLFEALALIHSEISEAVEAARKAEPAIWYGEGGKPEGIAVELADAVIRIADLCGAEGYDLGKAVEQKMLYNLHRAYRHGGKIA